MLLPWARVPRLGKQAHFPPKVPTLLEGAGVSCGFLVVAAAVEPLETVDATADGNADEVALGATEAAEEATAASTESTTRDACRVESSHATAPPSPRMVTAASATTMPIMKPLGPLAMVGAA